MIVNSQEEIDKLIDCPKEITDPPKKEMWHERGSIHNNMKLRSKDGEHEFMVFMRINEKFNEDFSIGMNYKPQDTRGDILLLRLNGPHGYFNGEIDSSSTHFQYHIHKAKIKNVESGLRPEKGGESTDKYASYGQALIYFIEEVNITNAHEFFSQVEQSVFKFEREDNNP